MACCGGCCGTNKGTGPGPALMVAGLVAGAAVLIGVIGMGRTGEPPKAVPATQPAKEPTKTNKPPADPAPKGDQSVSKSPLDFKVQTIDGKECDLGQYKGKVVLIVNTASKCGFTDQYTGLQ